MKKIVSVLVLSLLAGQASAQITNHSIEKNLEQCIALAQHSMSNEEIIATVQEALDQAAYTEGTNIEVKTPSNKKFVMYVVGGTVVAIGIGAGIYYFYNAQNNTTNTTNLNDID